MGIVNISKHVYEGYKYSMKKGWVALATDYGFVILEKRFVDVTRRYGIMETYIQGWDTTFRNKEYFEEKMRCSIYDVLPNIGKTTLLCPPPWKPPTSQM